MALLKRLIIYAFLSIGILLVVPGLSQLVDDYQYKVCCDGTFSDCYVSKLCIGSTPVQVYGSTTYQACQAYLRGGIGGNRMDWGVYCLDPGTNRYCGVGTQPSSAYPFRVYGPTTWPSAWNWMAGTSSFAFSYPQQSQRPPQQQQQLTISYQCPKCGLIFPTYQAYLAHAQNC